MGDECSQPRAALNPSVRTRRPAEPLTVRALVRRSPRYAHGAPLTHAPEPAAEQLHVCAPCDPCSVPIRACKRRGRDPMVPLDGLVSHPPRWQPPNAICLESGGHTLWSERHKQRARTEVVHRGRAPRSCTCQRVGHEHSKDASRERSGSSEQHERHDNLRTPAKRTCAQIATLDVALDVALEVASENRHRRGTWGRRRSGRRHRACRSRTARCR